jgi:hypothetical protein
VEGKSANSRFFLSRSAPLLFFALFFFALSRSFFGFKLASAKAQKREKSAGAHLCRRDLVR